MMIEKVKPKIVSTCKVYKNKWIEVEERKIDTNGQIDDYYVVTNIPQTASILLVDNRSRFLTVRQYRFAVDSFTIDIPGGIVDAGESPKEAAVRELYEETGYKINEIKLLFKYYLDSGQKDSVKYVFIAEIDNPDQESDQQEENIHTSWRSAEEIYQLITSNEILEPTLVSSILFYSKLRSILQL